MRFLSFVLLAAFSLALSSSLPADENIDFNRDVRPILSGSCFTCHGPDAKQREADLRLDTRAGAVADLGGYAAIVPGEPDDSELILRITSDDPDERMPPPESGKTFTPEAVERLRQWVQQGAPYAQHWSYVKPNRAELPDLQLDTQEAPKTLKFWPRNAIDHFVLARLLREGLQPSSEADRYTLIRRVSLDLTGLPPTIEEVDAFVGDISPEAYERMVDRLLAKDTYGEHWARMWLDLARYADSAGYADDPPRTIWAFRDYVIRSLNADKPFDQFTIEQIAGDLLDKPTDEQLTATAFHRNTLTNNEGGTNDEEFRNVAIVDRVNTTMAVWMGTTMNCAQCHSHKYDPISQEEFFRMFAIFNNTEDADRKDERPTKEVWSAGDQQENHQLAATRDRLLHEIKTFDPADGLARWEAALRPDERPANPQARFVRVTNLGADVFLHLAEVQVFSDGQNVAPRGKASQVSTDFGGPAARGIDGNTDGDYHKAQSTTHTAGGRDPWWEVDLQQVLPVEKVVVWNRTDGGAAIMDRLKNWRLELLDADRKVVWSEDYTPPPSPSQAAVPAGHGLPARIAAILEKPQNERTAEDRTVLAEHYRRIAPELASLRKELKKTEEQLKQGKPTTTVPIMRELAPDKRRKTHVQIRGNFLSLGPEVTPGLPAAFQSAQEEGAPDRLALAKWLVDDDNPLTPRVIANRYWEAIFGIGIVRTSEEFGSQGELPSHPELLDWLATELVREHWDLKHLLRLLVTSATYRQSSRVTPELHERDPDNRLLARGPRFRLSAEMIRDQALLVGGLLSAKIYGPPVKPPQPNLGLRAAFGGGIDWKTSAGEDRYRRALYTTWRRSNPYPSMATFDAPNREVCTVRRARTNTPLQALVTLNDPVYVEAAQALARRMAAADGEIADKAALGFRLCLARPPQDGELQRLVQLHAQARARFVDDLEKAQPMATKPLGPAPPDADIVDLAAWTVVGNVLLNLDELLMKR